MNDDDYRRKNRRNMKREKAGNRKEAKRVKSALQGLYNNQFRTSRTERQVEAK